MRAQLQTGFAWLTVLWVVGCLASVNAAPAARAGSEGTNLLGQMNALENRFFFHQYASDPLEKRLERLELLVFGQSQSGDNAERLAGLKKAIAERDKESASRTAGVPDKAGKAPADVPDNAVKAPVAASSPYPVLNTLEWRALKKTYTQEGLDQRLQRLETKIFGQASPAMAYADRVERLERTLGISASESKAPRGPLGPKPKAGSHLPDYEAQVPMSPPMQMIPFGDGTDMSHMMSEMFNQMNQQMDQLFSTPQGQYQWHFRSNLPTPANPGKSQILPQAPFSDPAAVPEGPTAPPYNDPNSI